MLCFPIDRPPAQQWAAWQDGNGGGKLWQERLLPTAPAAAEAAVAATQEGRYQSVQLSTNKSIPADFGNECAGGRTS